jgi:hypothetical protein
VGDIGMRVSDAALMRPGEEVLLFLVADSKERGPATYGIFGKSQGKYTVDRQEGMATKSGFALASNAETVDNRLPLEVLIGKIRAVLEGKTE